MKRILITGANRGIGLALVQHWLRHSPHQIFATYRRLEDASELQALAADYPQRLVMLRLELADERSMNEAVATLSEQTETLDILVNNAAIDPQPQSLDKIGPQTLSLIYSINTIAPLLLTRALLPLMQTSEAPVIVNMSSEMASLALRDYGGSYGYCASKAALNMDTRGLAAELGPQGFLVIALDPGWVRTDMGGPNATLEPEESARGIVQVIDALTPAQNGHFLVYDGSEHPW